MLYKENEYARARQGKFDHQELRSFYVIQKIK